MKRRCLYRHHSFVTVVYPQCNFGWHNSGKSRFTAKAWFDIAEFFLFILDSIRNLVPLAVLKYRATCLYYNSESW